MKITVKYNYKLTEENLEKDINKFISDARKGDYYWDYKNKGKGVRIIKQYFRIIQEKFDKNEFEECKKYYRKLIFFLFDASTGEDKSNFGYEDLLSKVSSDFDKFIKNYFICLTKTYKLEDLADECSEYAVKLKEYSFDSDKKILIQNLDKESLNELIKLMLSKTIGMTKKDEDKHNIIYFLMDIFRELGNNKKYLELCEKFKGILPEEEIKYLKEEWDIKDE